MNSFIILLGLFFGLEGFSLNFENCTEAGVDLNAVMSPVKQNVKEFYDNQVIIYNVDLVEPTCCSFGIAIVFPDNTSETGDRKCLALLGFGRIDISKSISSYDPKKGLLLEIPTGKYDPETGTTKNDKPVSIRINFSKSSINLEK